ncbi:4977_t:CDS:2, partial [Racocetra persica]
FDGNELNATFLFNMVILLLTSYYVIKWTFNPPTKLRLVTHFILKDSNSIPVSTIWFDRALAMYNMVTLLAGVTIFFVGVGKIWATVGVFHSAAEFVILVILGSGGRIKSILYWPILGFYIFIVVIASILLDFPYDALWFKAQGLCFDWALVIEFTLIYMTTCYELKHPDINILNLTHDDSEDILDNSHYPVVNHPHHL